MTRANIEYIRNLSDLETVSDYLGSKFFSPFNLRKFGRPVGQTHDVTGRAGYIVVHERMELTAETVRSYAVWSYRVKEYTRESDGRLCDSIEWLRVAGDYVTAGAAHERASREAGYALLDPAHMDR